MKIFTELYRKTQQLEYLNRELENRVAERTTELEILRRHAPTKRKAPDFALAAGRMGSWDWDVVRGDCMWDEGHCEIFGVDAKSFKVTPERVRALIDPADWNRLSQLWSGGGVGSKSFETEFRVRRPDGEVRWCLERCRNCRREQPTCSSKRGYDRHHTAQARRGATIDPCWGSGPSGEERSSCGSVDPPVD